MRNPFVMMALDAATLLSNQRKNLSSLRLFPTKTISGNKSGKYMPHQGKQECARRVRQMKRSAT